MGWMSDINAGGNPGKLKSDEIMDETENQNKRDLRTLVIRLLNESEDTMSPETIDVMRRLAPAIMAEIGLSGTWPAEAAAANDELSHQWDNLSQDLDRYYETGFFCSDSE